jgi:hypothetical protein
LKINSKRGFILKALLVLSGTLAGALLTQAADEDFDALVKRLQSEKPAFAKRQQELLAERYDLADRPAAEVTMSRGKAMQGGVRVKLPAGQTWESFAALTPEEMKSGNVWPAAASRILSSMRPQ